MIPAAAATNSFYQVLFALLAGILVIVILTTKFRLHPFFALLIASLVTGLGINLSLPEVVTFMKEGFGNIMKSLGFIIVLGTALGVVLEKNGSTTVMANYILKKIGNKFPALAMSITGFVVGLPVFCDSGFIVLSGLNSSLAKRTGTRVVVMAVSMATGLYSVHCLITPHPGVSSAAALIGASYGKLIIAGIVIAIPAMIIGYLYAVYAGSKYPLPEREENIITEQQKELPSTLQAFLPVIIPVLLIAIRAFITIDLSGAKTWLQAIGILGDPIISLSAGIVLALTANGLSDKKQVNQWLQEAAEKAGGILVIIGAGGSFGAILGASHVGVHLSEALPLASMGILFPFLLTAMLKTAQGSSTVAIITAASIIQPLLPVLGFATPDGKLLCVLAMGAGSMMVSHANDAYFWVIAKFEKIDMPTMLKVYSVATVLMGLVTLLMVYILSLVLL